MSYIGFREMRCSCGKHWIALTHKNVNSLKCPSCGEIVEVININDNFIPKSLELREWTCLNCDTTTYHLDHPDYSPNYCSNCGIKYKDYIDK